MPLAAELEPRREIMPFTRFQRRAVEDRQASLREGRYVAKDVDFALVTPPYSRDVIEMKVTNWLANMDNDVRNGRVPAEWQERSIKALQAWRNGQEIPLQGTAIRGWGVISPAQQEMLLRINILTVEDLAGINDEGARRIGMGAIELKHKAAAWLKQLADKGPLVQENAQLLREVEQLRSQVETMKEQIEALQQGARIEATPASEEITASDLLEEEEKPRRRQRTQKTA